MRLGIVPYLNAFPLVYGLDAEIYTAPPAKLPQIAKPDDILLAPIVTSFIDPSWYLIDGFGIGSFGPVDTVRLFFKDNNITIENIMLINLDKESKTSKALLKIIIKNCYHRHLEEISFLGKRNGCEGALVIGDKVWNLPSLKSLDLGEAWTHFTTLPFVYACWMTRSKDLALRWKKRLNDQTKINLAQLNKLVAKAALNHCPNPVQYWKKLKYDLDDASKKGIVLFQKWWGELEQKPILKLNWI